MEFDPKWLTDPQVFQVNRLPAHASYMVRGADGAPLEQTLDGAWKFFYAQTPGASPQEFYREGYDVSGWDEIAVPGYIQLQGGGKYGTPHYVNTQYPRFCCAPKLGWPCLRALRRRGNGVCGMVQRRVHRLQ